MVNDLLSLMWKKRGVILVRMNMFIWYQKILERLKERLCPIFISLASHHIMVLSGWDSCGHIPIKDVDTANSGLPFNLLLKTNSQPHGYYSKNYFKGVELSNEAIQSFKWKIEKKSVNSNQQQLDSEWTNWPQVNGNQLHARL